MSSSAQSGPPSLRNRAMRSEPAAPLVTILTIGLDAVLRAHLHACVGDDSGYQIVEAATLDAARKALDEGDGRPTILFSELAFFEKAIVVPVSVHVIGVAGPDVDLGSKRWLDDVIRKPIDVDDLRARLKLASRTLLHGGEPPKEVIRSTLARGESGEVVITSEVESARVQIEKGGISWVERSLHPGPIGEIIAAASAAPLDDQSLGDLLDEARRSRRHFGDVALEWGIVEIGAFRERLRLHIELELKEIASWTGARASFVRNPSPRATSMRFAESQLGVLARRPHRTSTIPGMPAVRLPVFDNGEATQWAERVAAIQHVTACSLLDASSGRVVATRGEHPRGMTLAWELVRAFVALGSEGEEIVAVSKGVGHLVRRVDAQRVSVVTFDSGSLSPALARVLVAKVDLPTG